MAAKDYALSLAICEAIHDYDPEIIVMGLSGSEIDVYKRQVVNP